MSWPEFSALYRRTYQRLISAGAKLLPIGSNFAPKRSFNPLESGNQLRKHLGFKACPHYWFQFKKISFLNQVLYINRPNAY